MQAGSSPYLLPPPQHYYQNIYHIPVAPQDHDLKRQYLTLLPSQQIIEICLTFDVHVPPYIKSTIWPPDISVAIENLRKPTASIDVSASATRQKDNDKSSEPVMASLDKPPEKSSNPEQTLSSTESQTLESQQLAENSIQATTAPSTVQTTAPAPQPTVSAVPPVHQQPQQSYSYPHHPPATYPHAPYYSQPPGYPAYPSFPPYPPVPNGYPHPHLPPLPPHPGYPHLPSPLYPAPQPPVHQEQGSDDLPSYEEMIVEALQESTDPEGCAPKDLFTWMATRYPVQSNFRPSASQALQKAYKRGRFEKSSNGKYRLSASWEGGNTSKRTTRRPQTQSQSQTSAMANTSGSPFTHAPLVHHHQQTQQSSLQYPGQPYPYPYGGTIPPVFPGYPETHHAIQALPQTRSPEATKTTTNATDKSAPTLDPSSKVDRDTYEAAQNILKAINFGDLFQMGPDGSAESRKADDISVDQLTSLLVQAQNVISQSGEAVAVPQVFTHPAAPLPTLSSSAGVAIAVGSVPQPSTNVRAELQAQFALLAAQLMELSQEHAESNLCAGGQPQIQMASSSATDPRPSVSQATGEQQQRPPSTALWTAFGPPIMGALIPPSGFSLQEPQPRLQLDQSSASQPQIQLGPHHESSPSSPRPPPQQDDIPIDPVLRGLGAVGVSSSAPPLTAPEQIPPTSPTLTIQPVSSAPTTTSVASVVASPPPPPSVSPANDSAPMPRPELVPEPDKHDAASNYVHEEADTDDEDMEEVA